jgi:hypothetical protein
MKFNFGVFPTDVEYRIADIKLEPTKYGWRKVVLTLTDVEGVFKPKSVTMNFAVMDLQRMVRVARQDSGEE